MYEGQHTSQPRTWLEPSQVERLRDACYDDTFQPAQRQRNEAIVTLLYDAGLSVGDLVSLDVADVDFETGCLTVPPPDDDATDRTTIRLDPNRSIGTIRLLKSYLYNRPKDGCALFPSRKSARMTPKAVRDAVQKVARVASVRPRTPDGSADCDAVSPHTLRHSTAWRILNVEDGDLEDVRTRLRHASTRTTQRVYGQFRSGSWRDGDGSTGRADTDLTRLSDGFLALDDDWRLVDANAAVVEHFDESTDLLGRSLWDLFPGLSGTRFEETFRRAARRRETVSFDVRTPSLDEWVEVRASPTRRGLSIHLVTITERKCQERELERYRTILETVEDGVYTLDENLNFDMVNDAFVSISGYSREELVGADGSLLATDDELERGAELRDELLADERESFTMEGEMLTAADGTTPIEARVSLLPGEDRFNGTVGVVRDVSERRRRECELEHYETILETIDDGVYTLDDEMRFATVNDAFVSMVGYSREQLIGSHLSLIVDSETWKLGRSLREEVATGDRDVASMEVSIVSADDEEIPVEVRFSSLPSRNEFEGTVGVVRDVSERKRHERELREEQAFTRSVLNTIPDAFYALSDDLSFLQWNDQLPAVTGYTDEEIEEMHPPDFVPEDDHRKLTAAIRSILEEGRTETLESSLVTKEGETIPFEYNGSPITDGEGEIVGLAGTARDVSDQKEYERTLTTLHYSTRELIHAETKAEVCQILVETATDVLNLSGVITHLYDADDGVLEPAAQDISAAEIIPPMALPAEDTSLVGHVYTTGEMAVFDDVNDSDLLRRPSTNLRSGLLIPLGRHGTFLAGSTEIGVFDDQTIELANVFAASAQAALDRVEREEELRDRGATLTRQRDELESLNEINVLMQEVRGSMLQASTRDEVEEIICRHLADSEFYRYAWISKRDLTGDTVVPDTIVGIDDDRICELADLYRRTGSETVAELALRTGETQVVSTLHDEEWFDESIREFAHRYDYHSTIAVPLTYGNTSYGVLGVVSSSPDAFNEREQAAFTTLGETIGFAISSVQNRQLLLTDSVVELEFEGSAAQREVVEFSRRYECSWVLEGTVPANEGQLLHYATISGTSPDTVREFLADADQIEGYRIVDETDDSCLAELVIPDSIPQTLVEFGAHVRVSRADGGETRIVAEVAQDSDIRNFVDTFLSEYPGLSLSSKQTIDRPIETAKEFRQGIDEQLTLKQRSSLRAAYHAGYYDWPRGSTAEEIAESMGISSPTLHHHLRRSHRKLLQTIFDDGVT